MNYRARITIPLAVLLPRVTKPPKKYIINKNNERNWHYIVSNKVKAAYCDMVRPEIEGLVLVPRIRLDWCYFKPTARRSDRTNVLSQHEKFFCDALVSCGCLEDDSDDFIESSHYYGGTICRDYPRVEVVISDEVK